MEPRALARQLGRLIRETSEYKKMEDARAKVEEHEAARLMLQDFKRRQEEYRRALAKGEDAQEAGQELQRLAEIIGYNPYLREFFAAEARLAELVLGLQGEIMAAAGLAEADVKGEKTPDAKSG